MPNSSTFIASRAAVFALGMLASGLLVAQTGQYAQTTLKTADVAPPALLTGEGFTVGDTVRNDGFQNTYTVNARGEVYTVTGNGALAARIREIQGTAALEDIQRSDAFKEAAKGTVSSMVDGGKELVTSPIDTTKKATKGLGRWLGNVGRSVSSDDPHQDNAVKTLLGHDATKRAYAIELGVDPYTDFEPFQEELGEVARAATSGGVLTSFLAEEATTGVASTAVSVTSLAGMKDILLDEPPASLARINREKLEAMGVAEVSIDALLKNYNYTPAEMTIMVEALTVMGDIKGRDIFVTYAASAPDRVIVRYVVESAEMLANYIAREGSGDIVSIGGEAWFLTNKGTLVGTQPVDYLRWTPDIQGAEEGVSREAAGLGVKAKELWIEGQVEPTARETLSERGWKVREQAGLLTGGA